MIDQPVTENEMRMKMRKRAFIGAAGFVAIALTLAGCAGSMDGMDMGSGSAPSSSQASADFNDADVSFAMNMVAHHQQAVEMADMFLAKDGVSADVTAIAQKIKDAQGPEIETMNGFLTAWGQSTDMGGMDGMNMDGMMTDADMSALDASVGAEADRLFLEQMITHHTGAIDMAQLEVDNGKNAEAVSLAEKIVADQTAEITTMNDLLASL